MSKMDGMRAMREARFKQQPARTTKAAAADPEPDLGTLCGHRAISGRTCTRELGHAAKSHRYS